MSLLIKNANNGLLSMPPNSQPAKPTHDGTAASQPLVTTKIVKNKNIIKWILTKKR